MAENMNPKKAVKKFSSIKRLCLGLSLLEAIIVLSITAALFDVINLAIYKSQQLNYDRDKAVYLVTVKEYVSRYMQQFRERPFCVDSDKVSGACPRVRQVDLSDIVSSLQYANLPKHFVNKTHVLLRIDSQNNNNDVGYLSALIFTEEDSAQKSLDTARINLLVGPSAGMLDKDGDTIENGRNTFSISKKDWDGTLTSKITKSSNVVYLPSGLVSMVKKSIANPAIILTKLDFIQSNVAHSCLNSWGYKWYPLYISDGIKLAWDKKNAATDHVKVEIKGLDQHNKDTLFYSSSFFNTSNVSIPADLLWYNKKLNLVITSYDRDGNPGDVIQKVVHVNEPDQNHFSSPFKMNFKFHAFNVNGQNDDLGSVISDYKVLIPELMKAENTEAQDVASNTFIKPLTLRVTTTSIDQKNNKIERVLYKQVIPDSRTIQYLPEQADFKKLMEDSERYPFKINKQDAQSIYTTIQLLWDQNVLRNQVGAVFQFDNIPDQDALSIE